MDGANDMWDIWSAIYDAQQLENPHLQRRRSTRFSSDSGSNENGSSTHVFDEMDGLEYPHAPQSTPTGSVIAADRSDNISESDSYIGYTSSALRSTPPNEQESTPTGCQFGLNSAQDWWDRPQALIIDEFEIKLVHSAILHIVCITHPKTIVQSNVEHSAREGGGAKELSKRDRNWEGNKRSDRQSKVLDEGGRPRGGGEKREGGNARR